MFSKSYVLAAALDALADDPAVPPARVRGPLVVLPPFSDFMVRWPGSYFLVIGPLVLGWRATPTARGLGVFLSASRAAAWGVTT